MNRRPRPAHSPFAFDVLEPRSLLAAAPLAGVTEWGPPPQQHVAAEFVLLSTGQAVRFGDTLFAQRLRLEQDAAAVLVQRALDATRATFGVQGLGAAVIRDGAILASLLSLNEESPATPLATGFPSIISTLPAVNQRLAAALRALTSFAGLAALTLAPTDDDDDEGHDHDVVDRTILLGDGTLARLRADLSSGLAVVAVSSHGGIGGIAALDQVTDALFDEFGA